MTATFQQVQVAADFLRFITPQIATKLAVQLGRLTCQKPNNGPRSIRLLPFVEVNFCHGTRRTLACQKDKQANPVFKSQRSAL